jgi:hypothetical protein
MQVTCVRGRQKLVGRGMYRHVFRVGKVAVKVEFSKGRSLKGLQKRAVEVDSYQREIRKKLDFLPAYYGVVLAGVKRDGAVCPAVVTFHEYIGPLPAYSISALREIFALIGRASKEGYVLDIKPSNFGMKKGRIFYLDEYGVGKGPLPPDVLEDISKFVQFSLGKMKIIKST